MMIRIESANNPKSKLSHLQNKSHTQNVRTSTFCDISNHSQQLIDVFSILLAIDLPTECCPREIQTNSNRVSSVCCDVIEVSHNAKFKFGVQMEIRDSDMTIWHVFASGKLLTMFSI